VGRAYDETGLLVGDGRTRARGWLCHDHDSTPAGPFARDGRRRCASFATPSRRPLIGPVEASHGGGCGAFGESGTEQGALESLKIAAFERGANYVQVKDRTPPHPTEFCFDQHYRISGLAYRTGSSVATVEPAAQPRPASGSP